MSKFITFKPIGTILQEADLITTPQLEVALRDQAYYEDMRLGEILALRGWIKQDTADFFVQDWFKLVNTRIANSLRFGDAAIQQGLLKPNTVNFFLQNLFPSQLNNIRQTKEDEKSSNRITKDDITYWVTMSSAHVNRF